MALMILMERLMLFIHGVVEIYPRHVLPGIRFYNIISAPIITLIQDIQKVLVNLVYVTAEAELVGIPVILNIGLKYQLVIYGLMIHMADVLVLVVVERHISEVIIQDFKLQEMIQEFLMFIRIHIPKAAMAISK